MPSTAKKLFYTAGGQQSYTSFSGIGADVLITGSGGRLDAILQYTAPASGRAVIFYDAAVATSGGPFSASGHKVVGVIPTGVHPQNSGQIVPFTGGTLVPQTPFFSGLVAAAVASGTPSFSVFWSPEPS